MDDEVGAPPSPFTLMAVCASWRTTVLFTPVLWSNMEIVAHGDPYSGVNISSSDAERARSWMARLGNHSWSLRLRIESEAANDHIEPVAEAIRHPSSKQLRKLLIDADEPVTGVEDLSFPALESMVMHWRPSGSPVFSLSTGFPRAPNLKKLVLANVIKPNTLGIDKLPWASLTQLFIQGITLGKWRELIAQCTNLREGCFGLEEVGHQVNEFIVDEDQLQLTHLPLVTRLTFLGAPPFARAPAQATVFSGLKELNVLHGEVPFEPEWNISTPPSLLGVTTLNISGTQPLNLQTTLFRLLELAPSVTRLRVNLNCDLKELFKFITLSPQNTVARSLEHLDISNPAVPDGSTNRSFPTAEFQTMVRSRVNGSLKEVIIRTSGGVAFDSRSLTNGLAQQVPIIFCESSAASDTLGNQGALGEYIHWDEGLVDAILARN